MRKSSDTRRWADDDKPMKCHPLMVAAAVIGATVVTGAVSSNAQKKAAQGAANAQTASAQAGISEQQRQFDSIQELLRPYAEGGTKAFGAQQDLAGVNGNSAQQQAIQALQGSPAYTSALQAGENSILQNASATGGLRGGNTQAALGQFSPALLASTINDQYARLGGLSSMGLGAATQTGQFGQAASNNVSNLLQQQGAAQAGNALARGNATAGFANSVGSAFGSYAGYGGFGGSNAASPGAVGNAGYGNYKSFYDNGGF